jgi:hypothetical protein
MSFFQFVGFLYSLSARSTPSSSPSAV